MAAKMEHEAQTSEARFAEYVGSLAVVLRREDRALPLKDYCTGLLMPGERKSVEPMAAVVAPARVSAKHQSLLHLVGQAAWSDEALLAKVRELVLPTEPRGRSRRGLSMTQASPRRAYTRWAWRGNIAGGSARPTIVKSR
jgi:SRSO17 transposase